MKNPDLVPIAWWFTSDGSNPPLSEVSSAWSDHVGRVGQQQAATDLLGLARPLADGRSSSERARLVTLAADVYDSCPTTTARGNFILAASVALGLI